MKMSLDNSFFQKKFFSKQNILRSSSTKGKMAIRVYPIWDSPTSKQAMKTQKWQLPYFVDMSNQNKLPIDKIIESKPNVNGRYCLISVSFLIELP